MLKQRNGLDIFITLWRSSLNCAGNAKSQNLSEMPERRKREKCLSDVPLLQSHCLMLLTRQRFRGLLAEAQMKKLRVRVLNLCLTLSTKNIGQILGGCHEACGACLTTSTLGGRSWLWKHLFKRKPSLIKMKEKREQMNMKREMKKRTSKEKHIMWSITADGREHENVHACAHVSHTCKLNCEVFVLSFFAKTFAQLLEVVGATVAAAIAAHEDGGGSRHDSSCRRGTCYLSEKDSSGVADFDGQNWTEWNFQFEVLLKKNARLHVFHLVTKMEPAESEDAMVEIAELEATFSGLQDKQVRGNKRPGRGLLQPQRGEVRRRSRRQYALILSHGCHEAAQRR